MAKKKVEELTIEEKLNNSIIPVDKQPYKIPPNWCWVKINSISNIYTGNSINEKVKAEKYINNSKGLLYIATKDIDFDSYINYETNVRISDYENFKIAPANTSLLCIEGGSAGRKVGFVDRCVCFVNKLCAFTPKKINSKYIYYYLKTNYFSNQFNLKKHGLIGGVPLKDLININFPLPPLAEQERIVSKLDDYISKLNEAKEKLEKVVDTYEFRKSVILHKAFTGELTKNWREKNPKIESVDILLEKVNQEKQNLAKKRQTRKDKDFIDEETPYKIPNTWKWIKLKNICTKIVDGSHNPPKGESEKTDYIMLSATNIKDDKFIDLEKVRYLSKENFDLENQRTNIQIGDICFTSVGSIGRSCIFKGGLNICFQRSVSIITTPISSEYLKNFFDSLYFQNKVQFEARGSCQVGFYLNQLAISLIPLPPIEEQKEIVKILDSILTKEKQVKEIAEKEIERLENLRENLLARAFGGVLGTNDPNEENSIELLKSVL